MQPVYFSGKTLERDQFQTSPDGVARPLRKPAKQTIHSRFEPNPPPLRPMVRTKGVAMLNLRSILTAAAFVTAISTPAAAAPLALFPFEQPQYQPPQTTAYAPVEVEAEATELPSKFKRQVVSYATKEAPGTVVIDTPNTFLYLVLGNGRALR